MNSDYECQNKQKILRHYHVSLTANSINKFITVEDATEMGHMRAALAGRRSTTKNKNKIQAQIDLESERLEATKDAMTIPEQEPGNQKTKMVFMTVKLADSFIAFDQTGAYPRTSNRGNKYLCIF